MSNQHRAAALLREAANLLNESTVSATGTHNEQRSTPVSQLRTATRALFAPYTGRSRRSHATGQTPTTFWSHRFCLVSKCSQGAVPTRGEKHQLFLAGLGEKKITFVKSPDSFQFKEKLKTVYPKLDSCGGFELMRTAYNSKNDLESIPVPSGGYSSQYLSDESPLGQALCYIRPIQKDIPMDLCTVPDNDDIQEDCLKCNMPFPLRLLRDHVDNCRPGTENASEPSIPRRSFQTTVCQFVCDTNSSPDNITRSETGICPVCSKQVPVEQLPLHADQCCNETDTQDTFKTFQDCVAAKRLSKVWDISIVRRMLVQQTMDQLEQAEEDDWNKKLRITFIGEEGIDAGGLTREFLTILFQDSPLFENGVFSFDANAWENNHYNLMGKMVAMSILHDHPGPQNLQTYIVDFILSGQMPSITDIPATSISRMDIVAALDEISGSTNFQEVMDRHADLLEMSGFKRMVTEQNRKEAVAAVKSYFLFHRFLPSILQFREGLKLHGVLEMMQSFSQEASVHLVKKLGTDSKQVKDLYKATFSSCVEEKEIEEIIVYNFHQFLKKVERGQVSSIWISIDDYSSKDVVLKMDDVLQAFIGCPSVPRSMTDGIITFDHKSNMMTSINTCAPSINFSKVTLIKDYGEFEKLMKNIIIGAYGFGQN